MPLTDDEIREKYLERAIREINTLTRELQACPHGPRGTLMPVLGSGHPQADIFLLKYAPTVSEIEEGVAFFGRTGGALMKSLKPPADRPARRLRDALGEVPRQRHRLADPACIARVVDEIAIVSPKMLVVMGEEPSTCSTTCAASCPASRSPSGELQSPDPVDGRPVRAEHRRGARRGDLKARILVGLPRARPVVLRAPAVLTFAG